MAKRSKTVADGDALEPALRMWLDAVARALVREYFAEAEDVNISEFRRESSMCEARPEQTRKAS